MTATKAQDWDPGTYTKFRGFRLRPALDLLAQVPALPSGDVIDLGCGNGVVATDLRMRFAPRGQRRLVGVDSSPAMLHEATLLGLYDRLETSDAATWQPEEPPAMIFSNALLQWLPDHAGLLPKLFQNLVQDGVFAVQMPAQSASPSHVLLREISHTLFPDRFDFTGWSAPICGPGDYVRMLSPFGSVTAWETEYLQVLESVDDGHPVHHFTRSTAMRAILSQLREDEASRFIAAYNSALAEPYPPEEDGTVLMPFKRVFFVAVRSG